ncbi:MAG TPA: hypothetical protein VHE11_10075 [Steroidobacteraceae bacterium]|nr:hypothetical protein [Steroidobacteraceae bacterium]
MSNRIVSIIAVAALGASASASALAQSPTDVTFSATGTSCEDVNWSKQTLALHPRIAESCQSVVQRDGKYFVVFSGKVTRVDRVGRSLTVAFDDGERVTLSPPADMRVDIEGTMTRVRDLQRGQKLTFYVPQDRFVAEVPEGEDVLAEVPITQWEPQHLASANQAATEARPEELPKTATELGMLALGGLALVIIGAGLTTARYRRSAR